MQQLNLQSRIFMFSVCSSIEYDIKKHILLYNSNIDFTSDMQEKIKKRKNLKIEVDDENMLNMLDLSDFVDIICTHPFKNGINNEEAKELSQYFEKIIPIRNRVMHAKPLELGDRAILQEVIDGIDSKLKFIEWNETKNTRKLLKESPELLIEKWKPIKYQDDYYHNLPEPEFDDTGYIGRKREIQEINNLILDERFPVISIIGNGGIGKTAIVVKVLYELLEDPRNCYDAIIWTSLKARTLSNGEFVDIQNSIKDISTFMKDTARNLIINNNKTSEENVIEFMSNFRTLLVIDNLETINDETINRFVKKIPKGSKILITSRTGLGELEYRYNLKGMNSQDGVKYFRELSKYYGIEYKKGDDIIKKLVADVLYSNPLSIKWYINGMYNGIKEDVLQNKKEELIQFCMSNVYNRLTPIAKEILGLFQIEDYEMSYGEIDFYIEHDESSIMKSINELLSTNMVELKNNNYQINMMAKDYLQIHEKLEDEFVEMVTTKKKRLNDSLQDIKVNKENNLLNPGAILYEYKNKDNKIAAIYLKKSLEYGKEKDLEKALKEIEKACSVAPNYFECYKVKAFLNAEHGNTTEAIDNYNIALKKCSTDLEYATVYYAYSIFYTNIIPDNEKAFALIEHAEEKIKDDVEILLQKSRVLTRLGKFPEAEVIIKKIDSIDIVSDKILNIRASVKANLYLKWSEIYEPRDVKLKVGYIRKGIESIESLKQIDKKTCSSLIKLLKELSYMYYDEDALKLLIDTLSKNINNIKSINNNYMNTIKNTIEEHEEDIDVELFKKLSRYIKDYKKIAKNIRETNVGIIVHMNVNYGFIDNAYGSFYFSNGTRIKQKLYVGDIVTFKLVSKYNNQRAVDIRRTAKELCDYEEKNNR